jgi:hypothetical protein
LWTSRLVIRVSVISGEDFLLGIAARCATGVCQVGTCVEQTIGTSIYAYCYCTPGWTGVTCNQCSYLFIRNFLLKNCFFCID